MARVNIYLPDDLREAADRWSGRESLSEICARALRNEFAAAEQHRDANRLLSQFRPASGLATQLKKRFGLQDVVLIPPEEQTNLLRERLGQAAADYLAENLSDGAHLAVAGGRQVWCAVRAASKRRVSISITALGMHQADPAMLHAHPNSLVTLLWLLHQPHSEAHIIGSAGGSRLWSGQLPVRDRPSYFILASCARFDSASPIAQLVGLEYADYLAAHGAIGDYAYVFFNDKEPLTKGPESQPQMLLGAQRLVDLSRRTDARTMLVSGGPQKVDVMRRVLTLGLSNTLITDEATGQCLLE